MPKTCHNTIQEIMCRRSEEVGRGVSRLQKEREALEQSVMDMANKTQAMDLWLAENESKIPDGAPKALLPSAVWPTLASSQVKLLTCLHAVVTLPSDYHHEQHVFTGKQDLCGYERQAVLTYCQRVKQLLMTRLAKLKKQM